MAKKRTKDLSLDPTNLKLMWEKGRKIYKELKRTGLSDLAIAGILGNMAQESSFDPTAFDGSCRGYVQNSSDIVNYIIKYFGGYDHAHLLNYLIAGLTGKLPEIKSLPGQMLNTRFTDYLNGIKNISTIDQAVKLWDSSYEKSKGTETLQRINYGRYIYLLILKEFGAAPKELKKTNSIYLLEIYQQPDATRTTTPLPLKLNIQKSKPLAQNNGVLDNYIDYWTNNILVEPIYNNIEYKETPKTSNFLSTQYARNGKKLIARKWKHSDIPSNSRKKLIKRQHK